MRLIATILIPIAVSLIFIFLRKKVGEYKAKRREAKRIRLNNLRLKGEE
jgi:hypothetical protein